MTDPSAKRRLEHIMIGSLAKYQQGYKATLGANLNVISNLKIQKNKNSNSIFLVSII